MMKYKSTPTYISVYVCVCVCEKDGRRELGSKECDWNKNKRLIWQPICFFSLAHPTSIHESGEGANKFWHCQRQRPEMTD